MQVGHAAGPGAQALTVLSVTPAAGTKHVNGGEPVEIQFSAPLAAGSPSPVLSPAVAGQWSVTGSTMTFTPAEPFSPLTSVTVRVPAGSGGVRSASGSQLAAPMVSQFSTASYDGLRLAELLAQLGYLPLTWTPGGSTNGRSLQGGGTGSSQAAMAYNPPAGNFTWDKGYPYTLAGQWQPTGTNVLVRGALMAFEYQRGMAINGIASPKVWGALANTGIPVSPTADGTYPVYLRYRFQIMQGVNPDGSSYADPVSFVSYFNGGDAVHYFPRGSYGFQQSLGCVELPYPAAEHAYPYLTYGSLVTVSGW